MLLVELKDTGGKVLGVWMAQAHVFKTGSTGYLALGKVEINGRRFQMSCQVVEIGSKKNGQQNGASATAQEEPTQ